MPDHTDDSSLFAECLQAQATYGTLLPCEHFAPREGHHLEMVGAANAPAGRGAVRRGLKRLFGGNR